MLALGMSQFMGGYQSAGALHHGQEVLRWGSDYLLNCYQGNSTTAGVQYVAQVCIVLSTTDSSNLTSYSSALSCAMKRNRPRLPLPPNDSCAWKLIIWLHVCVLPASACIELTKFHALTAVSRLADNVCEWSPCSQPNVYEAKELLPECEWRVDMLLILLIWRLTQRSLVQCFKWLKSSW